MELSEWRHFDSPTHLRILKKSRLRLNHHEDHHVVLLYSIHMYSVMSSLNHTDTKHIIYITHTIYFVFFLLLHPISILNQLFFFTVAILCVRLLRLLSSRALSNFQKKGGVCSCASTTNKVTSLKLPKKMTGVLFGKIIITDEEKFSLLLVQLNPSFLRLMDIKFIDIFNSMTFLSNDDLKCN